MWFMPETTKNGNAMQNIVARVIARMFNPLFATLYYLVIILNLNTHFVINIPQTAKWMLFGLMLITSFILPGLMMATFRSLFTRNYLFDEREEKIVRLFIVAIFYFLTYYLLGRIQLSPVFNLFLLGGTTLVGVCILITFFWNISIYMVAMGALTGALLGISLVLNLNILVWLMIQLFFSGMVGFSALALNRHKPAEVYTGYLMGVAVMMMHFIYI
jgi:hypothetical protein